MGSQGSQVAERKTNMGMGRLKKDRDDLRVIGIFWTIFFQEPRSMCDLWYIDQPLGVDLLRIRRFSPREMRNTTELTC